MKASSDPQISLKPKAISKQIKTLYSGKAAHLTFYTASLNTIVDPLAL